jgi:hypothetical protein
MIYFAREKLGIYLNGFDWADGNDVLINMLHPSHSKSHTEATNHYSSLLVLESSNHNKLPSIWKWRKKAFNLIKISPISHLSQY